MLVLHVKFKQLQFCFGVLGPVPERSINPRSNFVQRIVFIFVFIA